MHIGYLTTEYHHSKLPPAGGIGTFVKNMAIKLIDLGHKVTIFLCLQDKDYTWQDGAIDIVQIGHSKNSIIPNFIASRFKIKNVLNKYIHNYNIDIIESPDWEGLHAFCNLKIPLVTRLHGSVTYFSFLTKNKLPRVVHFLEKKGIRNSEHLIGVTEYAVTITQQLFKHKKKTSIIYCGIDVSKFQPLPLNKTNTPLILHFGTLTRKKGVLDIPHIFNEIHKISPDCKLLLLGKDTIDKIEKRSTWAIMENNFSPNALQKVSYLGAVPQEVLKEYLAQATACIFTSKAETFGLVTIESMAMEKPVIIYDFPWVREIITHQEDGILIQSDDFKSSAEVILNTLNDSSKMQLMGQKARRTVANRFNINDKVLENLNFYETLI